MISIDLNITRQPLVSIIISSYNYERYVRNCIESALQQTYENKEIIVVDDGSLDNSANVISSFDGRVVNVIKENGGQASVFNKGFQFSKGEIICFVDSDDVLYPTAIEKAVDKFEKEQDIVKVHWPLEIIDKNGCSTGKIMYETDLSEGDLSEALILGGTDGYNWPCTSGNAWHRNFIERAHPIPEVVYKKGPDTYLSSIAPLFGKIAKISSIQGGYRIHDANNTFNTPFEERMNYAVERWSYAFDVLQDYCGKINRRHNRTVWERNSFWHKAFYSVSEIRRNIPNHSSIIFIDQDEWACGGVIAGRKAYPFTESNGVYNGSPADDESALLEFEKLRHRGAKALVLVWPAFWYLDYYKRFFRYINEKYKCVVRNERIIIYNLT